MSRLCSIPHELLNNIAFELACSSPLGPPAALLPLLTTCKFINWTLSHSDLYARIFRFKFDHGAVRRRSFSPTSNDYAEQLVHHCTTLQDIRSQDIYHIDCENTLFAAFIMMLDNDGKNRAQLEYAGIESFVDLVVRKRLYEGWNRNDGWPLDNTLNGCALWLMWMTTTEEKLLAEPEQLRQHIIQMILPFVIVPFRYAQAEAPPHHFNLPIPSSPSSPLPISIPTPHGSYPIYPASSRVWSQVYFSSRPNVSPPPASIAAKLIYFSRREIIPFGIPPHLPFTRTDAHARGNYEIGPTQEDVIEFNTYKDSKLVKREVWDWTTGCLASSETQPAAKTANTKTPPSEAWDTLWWRLRLCHSAWQQPARSPRLGHVYTPGNLSGLWQGRMVIPDQAQFTTLLSHAHFPPAFTEGTMNLITQPIYMRLREHHCVVGGCGGGRMVPAGLGNEDGDEGMGNAWFEGASGSLRMRYGSTAVGGSHRPVVRLHSGAKEYEYETYVEGVPSSHVGLEGGCEACMERERALEEVRRDDGGYEDVWSGVGLGYGDERGDEDMEDDADAYSTMDEDVDEYAAPEDEYEQSLVFENTNLRTRRMHDRTKIVPCDGVRDVIVTGETDERHGDAWNHYDFYGRVREWDGLVGILRRPRDPRNGYIFFYGYLVGDQNFVGTWRIASADPVAPAWESAFTMSRREEA